VTNTRDVRGSGGEGSQFLTRSEVAKLLGVSPNTVTRWAREGRLPCQVTLGGHHRFDRELVEQMSRRLVAGLLHAPLATLNDDATGELERAARALFSI